MDSIWQNCGFYNLVGEENLFVIMKGHGVVFGVAQSFIDTKQESLQNCVK